MALRSTPAPPRWRSRHCPVLRVRDSLSIANNRVHEIPQKNDYVTESLTKQGRTQPWACFERENVAVTVHMTSIRTTVDSRCWRSKTTPRGASST